MGLKCGANMAVVKLWAVPVVCGSVHSFHWMFFIHCLATPTFNSRAINNKLLIGEVEPMGDFVISVMCPACPVVV
jgi:hypothetical protein